MTINADPAPVVPVAAPAPVATSAAPPTSGNADPAAVAAPIAVGLSPAPVAAPVTTDPWAGLSADHKPLIEKKGWKSLDDAVKAYGELETKFSSTRPADVPKDVAGYDAVIVKPDNADALGYNDGFAKWYKAAAHTAQIPVAQAKALHDSFVAWAGEQAASAGTAQAAALNDRVSKTETDLRSAWGEPNNPSFVRNLDMSMRAIRNLDPALKDALVETGALVMVDGKTTVANAVIIKALSKVGSQMFAEDSLFGGHGATDANPFDPDTSDLTAQSRIFREDKQKAKSLIMSLAPEKRAKHTALLASIG